MGLCIEARSCKSHYNERLNKYTGKSYDNTFIGYIGFKFFRDALLKFASGGVYSDISKDTLKGKEFTLCWCKDKTMTVIMKREDFEEGEEVDEDYLNKLDYLKNNYPKVYAIYPLISHCDCEGEIPYEQCKMILPVLKEFYEIDKHNYGYSDWDYNFTEELISVITECIEHKGKLLFN